LGCLSQFVEIGNHLEKRTGIKVTLLNSGRGDPKNKIASLSLRHGKAERG
jgi:hypothetical protein